MTAPVNPALWSMLDPIFVDFEASSLLGWPIEMGWAEIVDGRVVSNGSLIRPHPDWSLDEWDELAEEVHHLTMADLIGEGRPACDFAADIAAKLAGRFIVSDAAAYDTAFLHRLLALLSDPPAVHITDIAAIARKLPPAAADCLRSHLSKQAPRHRAAQDAAALAQAWLAILEP